MTKIDDEMVNRAEKAWLEVSFAGRGGAMRAALEAALSPKPEPEIEVTEGMILESLKDWFKTGFRESCVEYYGAALAATYRAMESTHLKEWRTRDGHLPGDAAYAAKSAPQGVNAAAPVKETGGGVGSIGEWFMHSRKTDNPECHFALSLRSHRRRDD